MADGARVEQLLVQLARAQETISRLNNERNVVRGMYGLGCLEAEQLQSQESLGRQHFCAGEPPDSPRSPPPPAPVRSQESLSEQRKLVSAGIQLADGMSIAEIKQWLLNGGHGDAVAALESRIAATSRQEWEQLMFSKMPLPYN